ERIAIRSCTYDGDDGALCAYEYERHPDAREVAVVGLYHRVVDVDFRKRGEPVNSTRRLMSHRATAQRKCIRPSHDNVRRSPPRTAFASRAARAPAPTPARPPSSPSGETSPCHARGGIVDGPERDDAAAHAARQPDEIAALCV